MSKRIAIALIALGLAAGGLSFHSVEAQGMTLPQMIELLISLGIIPANKADVARTALTSPAPAPQASTVIVTDSSATLGSPITDSAGYITGYNFNMRVTFSNKGKSDMFLSNRGQGGDSAASTNSLVATGSYSVAATPSSLAADTPGISFVIPAGGTRTLDLTGVLDSKGQTGQVFYRITSFTYGFSTRYPSELKLTSGLDKLVISATFKNSPSVPQITVKSPNGGEVYPVTTSITFTWQENAAVKSPHLYVLDSSGTSVYSRALVAHDGENSDVLDLRSVKSGGLYKVKICDMDSGVCDASDSTFIVNGSVAKDVPVITVTRPGSGERYSLASPKAFIVVKAEVANAKSIGSIYLYLVRAVGDTEGSAGAKLVSQQDNLNPSRGVSTSSNTAVVGDLSSGIYYGYAVWKDAAGNRATDYSDSPITID
jgi:hypothetical protein